QQGPGQHEPGQHTPAPRPPVDPEAAREASRQVMHFGLMMLATILAVSLPLPWQAAALAFALGAVVLGIRALRAVWRSGLRGALVAILGFGLGLAALLTLSLVTMLALWPVQMERQSCLRDALTISATTACEDQFQQRLDETLERVPGIGSGS
ncbi:hypothetical protein, partial [Actinotalea sp. C106]|uniref:hypothetical protein n=1 Tax=Actinotalea sp. C106 TaxID=2908644 RepID=UPI002027CE1A